MDSGKRRGAMSTVNESPSTADDLFRHLGKQPAHRRAEVVHPAAGAVVRPSGLYARFVKRAVDLCVVLAAIVPLLPIFALVAVAVAVSLGRPVFFRQTRIGLDGKPFRVLKFRTMRPDRRVCQAWVEVDRRRYHKNDSDPRHTRVGRLLRRTSLDELPQLFNVLRGDMSLVGPRPELVDVVRGYESWQHDRHLVRPGLTGLWQVSARGDGMMHEFTHVDIEYVERFGAALDLVILLRTIPSLLMRRGA